MEQERDQLYQGLQTEQEKHPSSRQDIVSHQWSSVESDTESLAQERAYQQQLQVYICSHEPSKSMLHRKENADRLQHGDGDGDCGDEDANGDDIGLQVYDSLEMAAQPKAEWNLNLHSQSEYFDEQTTDSDRTSQLLSDEDYSDLRCDPDCRTNLKGASHINKNPKISVEEYYHVPKTKSSQGHSDEQERLIKGGYRYIVNTSPALVVTPPVAHSESEQPYHLHSQDVQICSETSHNHTVQHRSPEADLSSPAIISTADKSHDNFQRGLREKRENSQDKNDLLTEDVHAMHIHEVKTHKKQERRCMQGGPTHKQQLSNPASTSPRVLSNKTLERLREDIVERNKITLGRNTSKGGSYVTTHAQKHSTPDNTNKVLNNTSNTGSQEDSSDPKLRWLQGTQHLKVMHMNKGKKAQWKENPKPLQQQPPSAPGVRAEQGVCLSPPLARPVALTQPTPQETTSQQGLPSTIHLNINLNTTSRLFGRDAILNLASLYGCPQWIPASRAEVVLSHGYQQISSGMFNNPDQWQSEQLQQNLIQSPTTTTTATTISSPGSGSYTVLPPIGKPVTGNEHSTIPASLIPRSSSDGYLVQMEKQKQLRTGVSYKAYSLKDYKQLKSDVTLRGLGPDLATSEKTAEKMKRQRLYSNVVREQNKKIRRIPFRQAKDLEGDDKKVPRIKALEYARTIAKPPVQPQPKRSPKPRLEDLTEHATYLENLDVFQPVTLEVLRKRHEEEKQAVALFKKVHTV